MTGVRIQVRRGTEAEWAAADPVLASGEWGLDRTNNIVKIGDGSTVWSLLDGTTGPPGPTGETGPTGPAGADYVTQDTGWRIWPEVAQTLTYTGGTADVRAQFMQRRIGPHVHSSFLFTIDSPERTATAGAGTITFDSTGHMFPSNAYATSYTGNANLPALAGSTANVVALNTGRPVDGGWLVTLSVPFTVVRSTSVLVTGTTYRPAGGAPFVTDDPWPETLPGTAYTP